MDIGIKIRTTLKNDLFYKSRTSRGYMKLVDFVAAFNARFGTNISYQTMLSVENLSRVPTDETIVKLCEFLDLSPEELFPKITKDIRKRVKKINKNIYLVQEAKHLISGGDKEIDTLYLSDLREVLSKSMGSLEEKERKVLNFRFIDQMTLEEVGNKLNVTSERVRQLESRGLRKLRNPNNARALQELL